MLGIKGRLQTRTVEIDEENKKYITEVIAEKVTYLSSKKKKINNFKKNKSQITTIIWQLSLWCYLSN